MNDYLIDAALFGNCPIMALPRRLSNTGAKLKKIRQQKKRERTNKKKNR